MSEEEVTNSIMDWLESCGWEIVSFDFPQSGTGRTLHPNPDVREYTKNKRGIIPDIVAIRNGIAAFFENKDRYEHSDFEKVQMLRENDGYSDAIDALLSGHEVQNISYGVGGPDKKAFIDRATQSREMVDFIVVTDGAASIVVYDKEQSF